MTKSKFSEKASSSHPTSKWVIRLAVLSIVLLVPAWLAADWWSTLPETTTASFVGRGKCIECHTDQFQKWQGSHHDLAMDLATPETVLGNFDNATVEHFGVESKMFRRDNDYFVHTEGPDGTMQDFRIKYVFGVDPLQQYLVEFDRTADMPPNENARLQVLRTSWNTLNKTWLYLSPPDVQERLAPDDPLHWTGSAQNWNHMCADCHSTNLQKNFDVASRSYHTTFTDIDVSCEACHGPGSVHVDLATASSVFWDRKLGYGLKQLKSESNRPQVESCAPCHSRRSVIANCNGTRDSYYDCFENELLQPETYYADGQIRDEVYVYGSFIQSKMYHKGIKCSDCHDPHSAQLLHEGNKVCTSCHQHDAAKYDTIAHHNHPMNSTGASCVECHMPATPFMEVDLRRDHSLRVPRPDLSVALGTPNACTACHLKTDHLPVEKRDKLTYYSDWLAVAAQGDEDVAAEIERVDQWMAKWFETWFNRSKPQPHFANALAAAWSDDTASKNEKSAEELLTEVIQTRDMPAIAQSSALWHLFMRSPTDALPLATRLISDRDPQLRATALRCLQAIPADQTAQLIRMAGPRLSDDVRLVRIEAANLLAGIPRDQLPLKYQKAMAPALEEYQQGLRVNADQAGSHLALGILHERMGQPQKARNAYEAAIKVQPGAAGPRSNLAQLLERFGESESAKQLLADELKLLARDASLAPEHAAVQYRYGLSLYLNGQISEALPILQRASALAPDVREYALSLALLQERLGNFQEAYDGIELLLERDPSDGQLLPLMQRLRMRIDQ